MARLEYQRIRRLAAHDRIKAAAVHQDSFIFSVFFSPKSLSDSPLQNFHTRLTCYKASVTGVGKLANRMLSRAHAAAKELAFRRPRAQGAKRLAGTVAAAAVLKWLAGVPEIAQRRS